ncbi:MAG TPA: membrane protein insertion efficiency factor YidD [Patescibacteria group bacterium]|nr:membrane protein insertion efficiency factor YidD [Patescibacteria group bacterium]
MQFLTCKLIDIYQIFFSFDRGLLMFLAPGGACKYQVSCSEFTKLKIREIGVIGGIREGIRRIISCR